MSNNIVPSDLNNNIVCEAVGCYSKADIEVHIKVGSKGTIPVFLCVECRSKFHLDENAGEGKL